MPLPDHPLHSLSWRRLTATLLNIRSTHGRKAHTVSVFQAIVKGVTTSIGPADETIFFHLRNPKHYAGYRQGVKIVIEVFFCRHEAEYVEKWRAALSSYLDDPETGKNFQLLECSPQEVRTYEMLSAEVGEIGANGELCLEFITPLPFKPEKGRQRTFLDWPQFIRSMENRFSRLFGKTIHYHGKPDDFTLLPYYWNYTQQGHESLSQPGNTQYINGCMGKLYLKGRFDSIIPFLVLGSELHLGTKLSNSQGHYQLHRQPPGFFQGFFPSAKGILAAIHDVLNRYDSALESLSAKEKYPFNEEEFAEDLCRRIREGNYEPAPSIAFAIRKKVGSERQVEQLGFRDLIVQQYVLGIISKPFDRMFEEGSIGYRKGVSRHDAIGRVQTAIAEGFQYVIESDVEDFFPSVDLNILDNLLDHYLPGADTSLRTLLGKLARSGFLLNGSYHERLRGLAQGSPLSPLFANLYLDSFDERIAQLNARMIRYADDFIILTKTREDAERGLLQSKECLADLGLCVNQDKTAIRHVKEGFRFLGMSFMRSEVVVTPDEDFKRFKKPLYITEPYLFLSLNGDAIEIRRYKEIVETIPIRRLSEIIIMEKATFSTALIRKCTDSNIPMTITLNTGYYVTTIKPDSKQFYAISYEHMRRHASLTETELLCIAKEFAAGKLRNYQPLFRQKYTPEIGLFIHELDRIIERINQAESVNAVRGHEGSAAKKIFHHLNHFIDDERFHIKKRDRDKPDPVNSLLNFGYYLLFSRINATVRALGLNPYLGFLHKPEDNYESLVCDIEELFRSRIDRFIVRLINLKIITPDDFQKTEKGDHLSRAGVKKYLAQFEAEMERKNEKNPLTLKESIYVQASVIKKFVMENGSMTFHEWRA